MEEKEWKQRSTIQDEEIGKQTKGTGKSPPVLAMEVLLKKGSMEKTALMRNGEILESTN